MTFEDFINVGRAITRLDIYLIFTRELYKNPKITCSQSEKINRDKILWNILYD